MGTRHAKAGVNTCQPTNEHTYPYVILYVVPTGLFSRRSCLRTLAIAMQPSAPAPKYADAKDLVASTNINVKAVTVLLLWTIEAREGGVVEEEYVRHKTN